MQGEAIFSIEDKRDEIINNDYYIKTYENNIEISNTRYDDIPEENTIVNGIKDIEIKENNEYKIELLVKVRDREYILSTFEFNTSQGEILGITNEEEYRDIQPEGNYIVLNDLDFRDISSGSDIKYRFGGKYGFNGKLDFNGHTVHVNILEGGMQPLFYIIEENAEIENLNLKVYMNNDLATNGTIIFSTNKGKINNLIFNLEESKRNLNRNIFLFGQWNNGVIDNFILKLSSKLYGTNINCVQENKGIIKNGYLYGETIEILKDSENSSNSALVKLNYGEISNIYSLININAEEIKSGDSFSNLVCTNALSGNIKNIYTVGLGTGYKIEQNVNSGSVLGSVSNSYYMNDEIFKGTADLKTTKKVLYDTNFQNNLLNSENRFEVDELIDKKYYPQLKMPECMPRQDYISLPEVENVDLPDVVSATVLEQENKRALIQMNVYNPSGETITNVDIENITANIISQEYSEGQSSVIIELTNPIICVSTYSINSITTKGAYNLPYTRDFESGERYINVDLYNEIWNIDGWKVMKRFPNQNYKLMEDLDFKNGLDVSCIGIPLAGILDGNNYTIQNIHIDNKSTPLFSSVRSGGKICNLNIKDYYINSSIYNLAVFGDVGNATFENINLENIVIEHTSTGAIVHNVGIIGNGSGASIKNLTANNLKISIWNQTAETYIGGLIGYGNADIENSYINNISIEEKNNSNVSAIGSLVGCLVSNNNIFNVRNVYINGKISSNSGNIGGLIGNGSCKLTNSYAYVDIIGNGDYIGGIIGRETASESRISNNLYIGNIINKKITGITGALAGNDVISNNNYAYYINKINGQLVNIENLLNYENLLEVETYIEKLKFNQNFNYEKIDNGLLPILNYSDSNQLLPNQIDIYLPKEELVVESIEKLRLDDSNLQIQVIIKNPANSIVKDLVIDDMDYTIISNINVGEKTYLTIKASPTKYYDIYRISKVVYENNGKEVTKDLYDLIEESFYKRISNFTDWQTIDENEYENYRILGDIDFSGRTEFKHNIKVNKMITDGQMHSLKNIKLNANTGNFGLIQEIKTSIENISFENITIENENNSGNYIGVIANNHGDINNISFKDITINLNDSNDYIGCIASSDGLNINKITLDHIEIKAHNNVGSLFGKANATYMQEINVLNANITGNRSIGGIIGSRSKLTNDELNNLQVIDSNISGNEYIGGVWGSNDSNGYIVQNIDVINCKVEGDSYIGGVAGSSGYNNQGIHNLKVIESEIIGNKTQIGGLFGNGGKIENCLVENSRIIASNVNSNKIGGLIGYFGGAYWPILKSGIVNSNINSFGSEIGGIIGNFNTNNDTIDMCFSVNTNIEGYSMIGGIVGKMSGYSLSKCYTNANIKGNDAVGGLVGYLDNMNMDNQSNVTYIRYSYYADGTIQGKENVGGIIGEIAKELYDASNIKYYQKNFVQADIVSESNVRVSLGIGSNPEENVKLADTYYYKYSTVNGENPNKVNEAFITDNQYLVYNDLKQKETYTSNLSFSTAYWNFEGLSNDKYPMLQENNIIIEGQEAISLPKDSEHIIEGTGDSLVIQNETNEEQPEATFEYMDKEIETYSTYSVITDSNGNQAIRNAKLYVKDNNLYAMPVVIANTSESESITPVADNLILDSYNGKEYETVLGSDGKLYDLKERITYPENFVNSDIESIGNNLDSDIKEMEVTYKNGDKLRFNYQTGEIISSSKADSSEELGLVDYIKEKISEIGDNSSNELSLELANKYEESKKLQNKLEETSVEEAIKEQNSAGIMVGEESNETTEPNNSLEENKYISMYNQETGEYEIYNEEELLDTSKEEVVSENEKIESNNLKDYYASEGETKSTKMGIVWIVISIIGVGIILFILKKNLKKKA